MQLLVELEGDRENVLVDAGTVKVLNAYRHRACAPEELLDIREQLTLAGLITADGMLTELGQVIEENSLAIITADAAIQASMAGIKRAKAICG